MTTAVTPTGPSREEFSERLLKGSVKKSYAPVVDIDWDAPLDPDKFFPWVQDLVQKEGPNILRCKGILAFKGDDQRFVFQGVHMILDGDHQRPWKENEKRESRVVFIGRELPEELIRAGFESCIVDK